MHDAFLFTARGFGPGLPPAGAEVQARLTGEVLHLDAWPEAGRSIRVGQFKLLRQDARQLLIEWDAPGGRCALVIDGKVMRSDAGASGDTAAEFLRRMPNAQLAKLRADSSTRSWFWGLLFVCLALPVLLLSVFLVFRGELVDLLVERIPLQQEQRLADELWKLQRKQLTLIEGTPANRLVEELGARLVAAEPTPYAYRFHLVDDKSVNAFAMPAGYIVVHRGLIARAGSAEELAGVLAHEIQHVEGRHGLRGMVQAVGLSAVWLAVTGDIGGGIGGSLAGDLLKELAGMHFSREQEIAADSGGYARLLKAGIDPRGMASFFDMLAKEQGALPETLSLLSTHPASGERSVRLKQLMTGAPAVAPLTYDWAIVQASLESGMSKE